MNKKHLNKICELKSLISFESKQIAEVEFETEKSAQKNAAFFQVHEDSVGNLKKGDKLRVVLGLKSLSKKGLFKHGPFVTLESKSGPENKTKFRAREIDALRGLAVFLMIPFHALVIGTYVFPIFHLELFDGLWFDLGFFVRFLFLALVGVSVVLSSRNFLGQVKRSGLLWSAAIAVSLATMLIFKEDFVRFGVLHFIAFSLPILSLLKNHRVLSFLSMWLCIFLTPIYKASFLNEILSSPWDYFPIFPMMAIPIFGLLIGDFLYADKKKRKKQLESRMRAVLLPASKNFCRGLPPTYLKELFSFFEALGKRALLLYLLHFPVLYLIFFMFYKFTSNVSK